MLVADNVSQGYNHKIVLKDINFTVGPGITGLLGANGAGKTTLLETLATVRPPICGQVLVDGKVIATAKNARMARRRIGYLPQEYGIDPSMTVGQFVEYGAWVRGVPREGRREEALQAIDRVDLSNSMSKRMGSLSGGMKQRAAIAWAIVGRPPLVILDEPTVGLDPSQRLQFRRLLADMEDTTIVLSTHLTEDIDAVCDRVIVLNGGTIGFDGDVATLKKLDDGQSPGDTTLERAYMSLLFESEPKR